MKKIVLFPLIFFSIVSSAQTFDKRFSISTEYARNFVIPEYKNARGAWSSIYLTSMGYYFKENKAIGLNVNFHVPPKNVRELLEISTMAFISPFIRLYKQKTNGKILPFIQIAPKYGFRVRPSKVNFVGGNGQNTGEIKIIDRQIGGQINAGMGFRLANSVFFDTSIYFDSIVSKTKSRAKGNVVGVNLFDDKDSFFNTGVSGGLRLVL